MYVQRADLLSVYQVLCDRDEHGSQLQTALSSDPLSLTPG